MPDATCPTCCNDFTWTWEEAFDKFGFGDGSAAYLTDEVVRVLDAAGYDVDSEPWGIHNTTITSILKDDVEQIPDSANLGYDDPRHYLPKTIIALLDEKLPETGEVVS